MRTTALATLLLVYSTGWLSCAIAAPAGSGHGTGADASGQTLPTSAPVAQVSADTDTKNATFSLTFKLKQLETGDVFGSGNARSQFLSVTATTPVAQGANYTNLVNFDGLTTATAIKLKYIYVTNSFSHSLDRRSKEYQDECHKWLSVGGVQRPNEACISDDIQDVIDKLKKSDDDLKNKLSDPTANRAAILQQLTQNKTLETELAAGINKLEKSRGTTLGPLWMFGVNGRVGYDVHKYFDPVTLGKNNATKVPFQMGLEATRVFDNGLSSLNFSFTYESAFKDANQGVAQIECKTTSSPITSCINGFIGAPTRSERDVLGLDLRHIAKPFGFPIGIDPSVSYDAKANSEAVAFPIYFVTGKSGGLSAGVRYDWNSEKHISMVGIFASSAFDVLDSGTDQ